MKSEIDSFIKKSMESENRLTADDLIRFLEQSSESKTLLMREALGGRAYSVDGGSSFHKSIHEAIINAMK